MKRYRHLTFMNLVPNQVINIDWKTSGYWDCQLDGRHIKRMDVDALVETSFVGTPLQKHAKSLEPLFSSMADVHFQLGYRAQLLKEFIFERVRVEQFSQKPSRTNCMFAFSQSLSPEGIETVLKRKIGVAKVYELEALEDSLIHEADLALLEGNLDTFAQIEPRANTYWSQSVEGDPLKTEVLIRGPIRVIERIR